jgi:hypothetical protein
MWFQRLVEIGDSELEAIVERTERSAAIQSDARIKMPKIPVSTPADFQRVRLMSTLRIREQKKKEERDRMFEDFAKMDALEWYVLLIFASPIFRTSLINNSCRTGNWDQSVANLPFTDFDNMMSRPRSPIFQSDVSQQLIGSLAANRMVNDSRDNEEGTGIETERNDRLKSGNLYHNAPTIPFKSPPRLRDLASRRKTVKVEAPAMTKGIFNRARGAGREGSDGVDVLATTGLGGLARKKNEGMDDKNEYSDMEIRNVGIELNERLRAAVAQRMTGYTAMDMKDEWECWLKDAVEAGGLRILSSDLSPNTSVSGIGQVTNNKLAMHPRFLDAAQLGQWQQIPDFLHNIVR